MTEIKARLGLLQRVMPNYRVPFFNALGQASNGELSVFAGKPKPSEAIETSDSLEHAHFVQGQNQHILSGPLYLCRQWGLMDWLRNWDPEVLIAEANPRYTRTPSAVRWMHSRGRPVIGWGLGAPVSEGNLYRLRRWLRKLFLQDFDALITYSHQGYEEYTQLGVDPGRIFIAPNAVAARPPEPPPDKPPEFVNGRPVILYVGRLQTRKRLDLLIHACAQFDPPNQPDLWIVGEGPVKSELEALADHEYPRVRFFGALYGDELTPIYRQADLFVLPGTGGLAVQQAMAHGLPVIVAEADGTQTDLVHPENGYLTLPGDIDQLHFSLKVALEDPARLRKMGQESYRIVREEINLEIMVDAFARAVELVLER